MCGILGVASSRPVDPDLLGRMRDTLAHRGPDDAGLWIGEGGHLGLAHRRLTIIDLSAASRQPMTDGTNRLQLAFNGEIYNFRELRRELEGLGHRFRTAGDAEVILEAYRAWGTQCLSRFNGMFAFALYDAARRSLFLARDRAGEKPLFFRQSADGFAFASELKALLADPAWPRRLDRAALEAYLAYGYVTGGGCLLEGVRKLPAAHGLTYEVGTGRCRTWRYWDLPEAAGPDSRAATEQDLLAELETLLADSVRLRLIADVPVGVMLSGGIDSSLVTAMAARVSSSPVKTFTISFPGQRRHDEAPYARLVARHFATEHVELACEPASVDLLPQLARQFDEPIGDSSMVPTYLVSRLIREHAKVALGGDGGDELFAGYLHYDWLRRLDRWAGRIPAGLRRLASSGAERWLPPGVRGRHYLMGWSDGAPRTIAHVNLYFDRATRRRLLGPDGAGRGAAQTPEAEREALCRSDLSPLQQATSTDFRTFLADDILAKVDRASMLASLEVRAPWLDPRIIELAFGRVPDRLRACGGERKVLPRRLAARLLPPALDLERKQGFGLPLERWLRGDWGRFVEDVLTGPEQELFDRATVRRLIRGQRRGLANSQRLFALTILELWRRHYRVTL